MIIMSIDKQVILVSFLSVFSFFSIRSTLWGVKELYLSKNERKRRKKGQSFKEWFLYTRYREEIPTVLIWLYTVVLIIHPISLICVIIAVFVEIIQSVTSVITIVIIIFDSLWEIIIFFLSWKPGAPWHHDEQWITKKPKKKR